MNSITLLFIFVPILVIILLMANVLLAVHRPDTEKVTAYECGFSPIYGQTRAPFSIQYYLVGILFLIFDLEILLLYPIRVTLYNVSLYGFWIAVIFFTVLTLGFVYELGKGRLYFTDQRSAINRTSIESSSNPLPNFSNRTGS
jgi:NADH:ubiquinone oxidoreductase subunit 3 (subunit A)